MTKDQGNPKAENGMTTHARRIFRHLSFGIDSSFVIRHLSLQS